MKKVIYSYFIIAATFIVGCNKNNNLILRNPDERLATALDANKTLLLSAANGWKATIYPKGGKGFSYYFQFTADGKVKMLSDFNTTSATELSESTYRLKALQRPTLIFDSYNYIHLLSDPDPLISDASARGNGLTSDFEFALTKQKGDTLNMEGIFNNNRMTMVKLSAAEEQVILSGGFNTMAANNAAYAAANKNSYITFDDGNKALMAFNIPQKSITISYLNSDNEVANQALKYAVGTDRLYLSDFYKYGTGSFNELLYDATAKTYYVMLGAKKINIEKLSIPTDLPLSLQFGFSSSYTYNNITIPSTGLPSGVTSGFTAVYKQMTDLFAKTGRTVVSTIFSLSDNNRFVISISYRSGKNIFEAIAFYGYKRNGDIITLDHNPISIAYGRSTTGTSNWTIRTDEIKPLADYMLTGPFKIAWVTSSDPKAELIGGFYRTADAGSFIYGNCE